jgi:hypothetical protein
MRADHDEQLKPARQSYWGPSKKGKNAHLVAARFECIPNDVVSRAFERHPL